MENFSNNHIVTSKSFSINESGFRLYNGGTLMYQMISHKIIENTTDEISFFNDSNCIGTRTIPANFLQVGNIIRIKALCNINSVGILNNKIRISIGNTDIYFNGNNTSSSNVKNLKILECDILVTEIGNDGKLIAGGYTKTIGRATVHRKILSSDEISFDSTVPLEVNVTYTWATASEDNILNIFNTNIEILNKI